MSTNYKQRAGRTCKSRTEPIYLESGTLANAAPKSGTCPPRLVGSRRPDLSDDFACRFELCFLASCCGLK